MVHGFDMAGYDLVHWITSAVMAMVLLYPIDRILIRIGLSSFWTILALVPFFSLIRLWVLAFVEWSRQGSGRSGQSDTMKSLSHPDGTMVRKTIPSPVSTCLVAFIAACTVGRAWAEELDGRMLVNRVGTLSQGETLQGEFQMTITTSRWQRVFDLRVWMERPRHSFVRVPVPAKEAGIGSLRIGSKIRDYLPNIKHTIKIPPLVTLQPRMDSGFTDDDLVKQNNAVDNYTHRVLCTEVLNGTVSYMIELIPKPDTVVVWGKILYWIRQVDMIPLKQCYHNERNGLMQVLTFSNVGLVGSRIIPTKQEIRPVNGPGRVTMIVVKAARYNQPIDDERFMQHNPQKS